jgi:hypothetical protein
MGIDAGGWDETGSKARIKALQESDRKENLIKIIRWPFYGLDADVK